MGPWYGGFFRKEPVRTAIQPNPTLRREVLRDSLPATVRLLGDKQAGAISTGLIEDYVALDWLEWRGGSLKLTITGENVCKQVTQQR
jgi:hypothetical protein